MLYFSSEKHFFFIFSIFGEWETAFCGLGSSSSLWPLLHFAHAAALGRERVGVEVEVPGAWAVVEVVAMGEEIGVEMMVETVGEMGVTNIQTGVWDLEKFKIFTVMETS